MSPSHPPGPGGDPPRGKLVIPDGDKRAPAPGAGRLGMTLFLASLGVLFAGSVVAYAVVRLRSPLDWRPAAVPDLPAGLVVATLLLAGCSVALQRALGAIRRGDSRTMRWALGLGGVLALSFLGCQGWNWWLLGRRDLLEGPTLYGFTFLMLTGLHALHVAGGLVALGVVLWRARGDAYSWAYHGGVRHCTVYWHFLGGVWLVLLALLAA